MSNRATIQKTIFTNCPNQDQTYGYRIYDDYGQEYGNSMSKESLDLTPEKFLKCAKTHFGDVANDIFDGALEHGGIYINNDWYVLVLSENDRGWEFGKNKKSLSSDLTTEKESV